MLLPKLLIPSLLFWLFVGLCAYGHTQTSDGRVLVEWDANTEEDLQFYSVHFGKGSRTYQQSISVLAPDVSSIIGGLDRDVTYFFAVTATDTAGNVSGLSNEVSLYIPLKTAPPDSIAPAIPRNVRGEVIE